VASILGRLPQGELEDIVMPVELSGEMRLEELLSVGGDLHHL
jgi:hypothetical protein